MRMQLDRNLEESNEYRRQLDFYARENKRLQEDLSNMTRENQVNLRNEDSSSSRASWLDF